MCCLPQRPNSVAIEVADTGIGIPRDDLPAHLRAILPRRQGPQPRAGRDRAGAVDRQAPDPIDRRPDRCRPAASAPARGSPSICPLPASPRSAPQGTASSLDEPAHVLMSADLPIERISSLIHTIFILLVYTGCPRVRSSLARADRRGRGRSGDMRGATIVRLSRRRNRPDDDDDRIDETGTRPMSDVRALATAGRPASRPGDDRGMRRRRPGRDSESEPARDGHRRRLEHGLPDQQGRAGGVQRSRSRSHGGRRQPRHRRRLRPLSPRRGRHRRCLARGQARRGEAKAKAQGIEWTRFVVGYDGITLVVNPKNDFVKSLTVDAVEGDLGAGQQGQDLEGRRPGLARPQDRPLLARTTTRGRSSSSPRRSSARRRASATTCSRAPTTTRWSTASPAIRTGWAISATPTSPRTRTSSGPWPCRTGQDAKPVLPEPRDDRRQVVRSAVAAAVHLREELGGAAARGRQVPEVLPREHRRARRQGGLRSSDAPDDKAEPARRSPSCYRAAK